MIDNHKGDSSFWYAPIYLLIVGILYLWGYWSSFNINIFEFISLSDVVKATIMPIGSGFFYTLLGLIIAVYAYAGHFPEGGGRDTKVGKFLNKNVNLLLICYFFFLSFVVFIPFKNKWLILPIFVAILFYLPLKNAGFMSTIKDDSVRSILIMVVALLPIYSFCAGKLNALEIINGKCSYYKKSSEKEKEERCFIGVGGGYIFSLQKKDGIVRIEKLDKVVPFELKKIRSSNK